MTRIAGALLLGVLVVTALRAEPRKSPGPKAVPQKSAGKNAGADTVHIARVPEDGIQPQVILDATGTLHLVYYKGDPAAGDVFYSRRDADGNEFSKPIRVNSQPGSVLAIGSIRGAQLAIGKGNRPHVAWNGSQRAEPKGTGKNGTPMLYARLSDDGKSFEPQRNLIVEAYGLDGGGSVAADTNGNVYVAWHANPQANGEERRRVYVARSSDEGQTFAAEMPADTPPNGACGCCGLKAFADGNGTLYLLYRTARENVNRDIYLLTSTDKAQSFAGNMLSKWQVAACPMSSESFAAAGKTVFGAWESSGQVYFARLDQKLGSSGKPVAAPGSSGGRKHPTLAVNARGETLLAWDEGTGWQKGGTLAWQVFDRTGKPTAQRGKADGIPVWSFPAAYVKPDGTFGIVY